MPAVARPHSPVATRAWCLPNAAWLSNFSETIHTSSSSDRSTSKKTPWLRTREFDGRGRCRRTTLISQRSRRSAPSSSTALMPPPASSSWPSAPPQRPLHGPEALDEVCHQNLTWRGGYEQDLETQDMHGESPRRRRSPVPPTLTRNWTMLPQRHRAHSTRRPREPAPAPHGH